MPAKLPPVPDAPQAARRTGRGPATAPGDLATIGARVEARLRAFLDGERDRWTALDPALAGPLARLRDLALAGGKRLRPGFLHWGFVGAGGHAEDPRPRDVGAAYEMLHTFALVHDDVIDGSATRRGRAAVHAAFHDDHRREALRGEARRFGEGVAILVGDLAFVYADQLAGTLPAEAAAVWNELRVELNMGQYLDLVGTARGDADEVRARRIVRYKSAKYTIERPLHLGAALAGRLDGLAGMLSAYGVPMGEAFQLRDDLLGVFGEEAVTGKPVGDDLREGKPTPLLALALAEGGPGGEVLRRVLATAEPDGEDIARGQQVLVESGAVDRIEAEIDHLRDEAVAALEGAPIAPAARRALVELAAYVTDRDR